ncbi:hypothetical protein BDN72DRAFT_282636 [Pluteus cervinus]|uniref:Uncharacterized protein n=1 Tax=Pluteus cervinus TaxID=181527 RepID=A0ACD3B4U3_9AGAR|nr:hypothetical protein BDN72DRAFT_282636 [Pluteus cervinus]
MERASRWAVDSAPHRQARCNRYSHWFLTTGTKHAFRRSEDTYVEPNNGDTSVGCGQPDWSKESDLRDDVLVRNEADTPTESTICQIFSIPVEVKFANTTAIERPSSQALHFFGAEKNSTMCRDADQGPAREIKMKTLRRGANSRARSCVKNIHLDVSEPQPRVRVRVREGSGVGCWTE